MLINPHITELSSRRRVAKPSKKGGTLEAQERIAKLHETMLELKEENLALREEIEKLRQPQNRGPSLELSDGVYWRVEGGERTGAVCPRCYEEQGSLVNLLDGSRYAGKARWICTVCNRVFD